MARAGLMGAGRTHERFFVVTGGPGSGKSTIVEALARHGLATTAEAGRAVIREQVRAGGRALPWLDRAAFADLMLDHDLRSYRLAEEARGTVVFDRGIPDVAGYLRLSGLPVPPHVEDAARRHRYNRRVFVAPPWPEIYRGDEERRQTLEEAERTYHAMVETYSGLGYELVPLPRASVEERVRAVLSAIG
jgi:predicted ATPase